MARNKSYNYSLSMDHQVEFYIPLLNIKVNGRFFAIGVLFLSILLTLGTWLLIRLIMDIWTALIISVLIVSTILSLVLLYKDDVRAEEGNNAFVIFYKKNVKNYRTIVTDDGTKKMLSNRKGEKQICIRR